MKWTRLSVQGDVPSGRVGHSLHAIGPDEILIFGGFVPDVAGQRVKLPFGPWLHSISITNEVLIFNTQSFTWRRVETKGDHPTPRAFHASCFNVRANKIVIHGGWTDASFKTADSRSLYVLNIDSMTWTRKELTGSTIPSDRAGHGLVYNPSDDSYLLFGDDKLADNKLYRITTEGFELTEVDCRGPRPLARRFSSLQLAGNRLYAFGGETSLPGITDVYVHPIGSGRWTKPLYEGSLSIRAQCGCVLNDKLILFGGVLERTSTTVYGASELSLAKKLFFLTVLEIREPIAGDTSQYKFKIVTVGDSGVGKSCLLTRFVTDMYSDFHVSTIGVDYKTVLTMVQGKLVKLLLWDTAGQERFSVVTGNYYRNADAFVIVYDATNRASFEHIDYWLNQIRQHHECGPNTVKLLCANKHDLVRDVVISETEGKAKADAIGGIFVTTSAKTSGNVDMAFLSIAQQLVNMRKVQQQKEASRHPSPSLQLGSQRAQSQVNCCV
jgi:Ras-related protein Rab-1A